MIGGGVAGMEAAWSIADMGFKAYLVEKGDKLGGQARNLVVSSRGYDYQGYLNDLIKKVESHPNIEIMFNSTVKDPSGFIGNFATTVATPKGERQTRTRGDHSGHRRSSPTSRKSTCTAPTPTS